MSFWNCIPNSFLSKERPRRSRQGAVVSCASVERLEPRKLLTGNWTALANPVPSTTGTGTMLLLSDGTVMVNGGGVSKQWFQLTPDSASNYVNGTWSSLASMATARRFYGSAVLPDGRVVVIGGEDSGPLGSRNFTNTGEIYDPLKNSWSAISNMPQLIVGDVVTETLPDGRIIAGSHEGPQTDIYNPVTNRWTPGPNKLNNDQSEEETWIKLPDGSILSYNVNGSPQQTQRYIPSLNAWLNAGTVPLQPTTNTELGPALLLPDGRVFFTGATGQTAFYTPPVTPTGTGSWSLGPVIPNGLGPNDAPAAELVNGHVLIAAGGTPTYVPPTEIFDFDPIANTFAQVATPAAMGLQNLSPVTLRMLALPSGQVLFTYGANQLYVYTPSGGPSGSWRPTIGSIVSNGGRTYTLTGTQLNGISEGASFGDDAQSATNYPIVAFTDANGVVKYARTFNWSTTGVATGSTPMTVQFSVPAGVSNVNRVSVIANGIASASVLFEGGASGNSNDTITIDGSTSSGSPVVTVTDNGVMSSWQNVTTVYAADGDGNDTYNVNTILAGIPVSLTGGAGNDVFNVTPAGMKTSTLKAGLTINGGGGTNTLNVNDQSDTTSPTWTVTTTSIAVSNASAIAFNGLQTLNIFGGLGADTYNIDSTAAGTTLSIQGGAGNDSFNVGPDTLFVDNLQGAVSFDGGGGNNSLQVDDQSDPYNDTWTIAAASLFRNAAAAIAFANFNSITLNGGGESAGLTSYNVDVMPSVTGMTINAGTGPGLLDGPNANTTWNITGPDSGSLGNVAFTGMQSLTGGTANDAFQFSPSGSLDGTIMGGDGTNSLSESANTNTWQITSGNAGTVNGQPFQYIQNLTGGSGTDLFAYYPGGFISGEIDGSVGNNRVDYSSCTNSIYLNLQTKVATSAGGGLSNITSVVGSANSSNMLVGANTANVWQISGGNAGSVNSVTFSAFPSLTGGTSSDSFQFGSSGFLSGSIAAGGGVNTLDYSARSSGIMVNVQSATATAVGGTFANITALIGGSGSNSLTGLNSTNLWTISGANSGTLNSTFTFNSIGNLTGGTGNDTFSLLAAGSVSGTIGGGSGTNTLDYSTR